VACRIAVTGYCQMKILVSPEIASFCSSAGKIKGCKSAMVTALLIEP